MSNTPVSRLSLEGTSGMLSDAGRQLSDHSPFAPNVDGNPIPPITIQNVSSLSDLVPPIEDLTDSSTIVPFGESKNDKIELHILNLKDNLLESVYEIDYTLNRGLNTDRQVGRLATGLARPTPGNNNISNVSVNLHKIFRDLGYISGKFKFNLNFHRNLLGSRKTPASLIGISDDRTQVSISYKGVSYLNNAPLVDEKGNRYEFYINLKFNRLIRISALVKDEELSTSKELVYTITLQNPLDIEIGPSECWIDQQLSDPVLDTIAILPPKKKDPVVNLRSPNFNIEIEDGIAQSTAFQSWDSLLSTRPTSSQELISRFLSSSFGAIELNVDYRKYSNFVFYGSAVERLNNFKYKLGLIEYYDSLLDDLNTLNPSPAIDTNISDLTSKKNALLGGFDGYEKYLYYESSSYETSSLGEFTPSTWPKQTSVRPYINYASTSSQGFEWYQGQLATASLYDKQNLESLVRTIPDFIGSDSANDTYTTFINMIGQHFDILRAYVEQLPDIHSRKEPLYDGLAKDLVYHVLRSLGIEAVNGFSVQDLWLSSLGLNQSGSYTQTGSLQSMPTDDIVKETWKRILNNLPYLLKTKGTERGIRALINCYGVPATVYRVREYSGPYDYTSKGITRRDRYKKVEKFTYAMFLSGSMNVTCQGSGLTVQFRFKPVYLPAAVTNVCSGPVFITAEPSGSSITKCIIKVAGGNDTVVDYNSWVSVTITAGRTVLSQNRDGQINLFKSISAGNPSSITLGGSRAHVQVQEVRYWNEVFGDSLIKEYCLNPQSLLGKNTIDTYDSNAWLLNGGYDYTAAYKQLTRRYPLGSTLQIYGTGSLHLDRSLGTFNANAAGVLPTSFVGNVENYYVWMPNLGDSLDLDNKIRIEDAALDGQLSPYNSIEKSKYDSYQLDSPKIGVFFSPQNELNEDIADQFGGLLLDDYIGDPRDEYTDKYKALEGLKEHYQRKFTDNNQIFKYLRLVENFDASMFYLIKKFLPARSAKMVGLVIQPNMFDRPKTFKRPLGIERMDWLSEIPMTDQEFNAQYVTYEATFPEITELIEGENIMMESNEIISIATVMGDVPIYETEIPSYALDNTIHGNVDSVMDSMYSSYYFDQFGTLVTLGTLKYEPLPYARSRYLGSKISSPGFNIPSDDTFDGAPVIEYWTTNPGTTGNTGNPLLPLGTFSGQADFLPPGTAVD